METIGADAEPWLLQTRHVGWRLAPSARYYSLFTAETFLKRNTFSSLSCRRKACAYIGPALPPPLAGRSYSAIPIRFTLDTITGERVAWSCNANTAVPHAKSYNMKIARPTTRATFATHEFPLSLSLELYTLRVPKSVLGGFRAQGRTAIKARQVVEDALAVQEAGAFAVVVECVPSPVAKAVTEALEIPTIGIGAGPFTSGQVGGAGWGGAA